MVYVIPRPGDGGWGSREANTRAARPSGQLLAAVGVGGTVTDFYVLLIPLYFVSKIILPLNKKIGVGCLFLTGLIIAEINIAILCGCIPVAFSLFKATYQWMETGLMSFKGLLSSTRSRSSGKPESSSDTDNGPPNLPAKIPRGILTGLRSFMQDGPRSQSSKAEQPGADDPVSSYVELESVDYETFGRL
ncbi:hypothetical protein DL771_012162 [Monosporascus sp. 5C6A]|nr:hypothetical protein DL771_012162 [Monosporascus sp. 5C6A]